MELGEAVQSVHDHTVYTQRETCKLFTKQWVVAGQQPLQVYESKTIGIIPSLLENYTRLENVSPLVARIPGFSCTNLHLFGKIPGFGTISVGWDNFRF